ncbi:helix-turn-helix domain-containing protein [Paractinoplanes rhizophilus]|uniref:Helix-turn-helix domain-containing protein n=1 Tax=Paractinoplanes rhizophilus TaxID=1416877 RepID=A0ABW2HQ30_9ACTN
MSEQTTPPRRRLREHVAEELRVVLARRKMSGAELARRTGIKQSTMSRRMTGETAFDMDDLEAIASVLDIHVGDLFPHRERGSSQDFDLAPAGAAATVGHCYVTVIGGRFPITGLDL